MRPLALAQSSRAVGQCESFLARPVRRPGLTLVELLVGMTVTMIMAFALIQMFQSLGAGVSAGRANLQLAGDLRGVANRLRHELQGLTVDVRPWPQAGSASGYFEYVEGIGTDSVPTAPPNSIFGLTGNNTMFGDVDDYLAYTVRSTGQPFVGRFGGDVFTSQLAEVVWWTVATAEDEVTLYHRILLIRPDLNDSASRLYLASTEPVALHTPVALMDFYQENDLSVRPYRNANGDVIAFSANTLADLTNRENRFAHYPIDDSVSPPVFYPRVTASSLGNPSAVGYYPRGFPFLLNRNQLIPRGEPAWGGLVAGVERYRGEDIALTSVLAFDVRAWDPTAPLSNTGSETLQPGDPGYSIPANPSGRGAFVDLNWASSSTSLFSNVPTSPTSPAHALASWNTAQNGATYCTWSFQYEHDGLNQNLSNFTDEGTDGFDNDGQNGVDDVGERETSPPYPVPLRGIQIRIRSYDNDTRQVRQTTVVSSFIPE